MIHIPYISTIFHGLSILGDRIVSKWPHKSYRKIGRFACIYGVVPHKKEKKETANITQRFGFGVFI